MYRVSTWLRRIYPPKTFAIVLSISIFVWYSGPVGTYEAMHPLFRGVYWAGLIFGAVPFARMFRLEVARRFPGLSPWPQAALVATGFSIAYLPVVYLATYLAARWGLAAMAPLATMWSTVFLAAACAYAIRTLVLMEGPPEPAPEPQPGPVQHCRLLQRLDPGLRGALISLSVRDHYVDVRTSAGEASLLLRLSDAIAETEGVEGGQVHRSHWVAWAAVEEVERDGSNVTLRMVQGPRIPVSRNQRAKLVVRGLL